MAITKVQQSALLTQLWTPDDAWQSPGNVTLSGVSAGNLVLTFGVWWDTGGGGGGAQQIPTDSNGTLAAGISPAFPSASPPNWPVSGQILRILSAAAGNHVITPPVLGVDGDGLFFAAEFSGGAAGTWTQVEANSNVVLSATPGAVDGVSVSTAGAAQVGDLVVALCTTDGDPSAIGVGAPSGYANEILLTTTTTVNIAAGAGWMIATSAGAQTASWAWADTACQLGQACIAVFRFTPSGPTITGQPSDQTVNAGATATFTVTATGATGYQWKKNGAAISGETASTLNITAAFVDQGALFTCDVTDGTTTVTSAAATLRVAANLSGTGPRVYPGWGNAWSVGAFGTFTRGAGSGGGGSTVAIGQASEADSAQPAASRQARGIGQASETDAAQPATTRRTVTAGQPAEADSAQALSASQARVLGQPSESDASQAVVSRQALATGQASEADAAHAAAIGGAGLVVGQPAEGDQAQPLTSAQRLGVAQTAESDLAQPITVGQRIASGQASESDAAQAVTQSQRRAAAQVVEIDAAQPVAGAGAQILLQAVESDTAQAFAAAQRIGVGPAAELDSALVVGKTIGRTSGQPAESDLAQQITSAQRRGVAQAQEADAALAASVGIRAAIGLPAESDAALAVQRRLLWQIGQAAELDAAQHITSIGGEPQVTPGWRASRNVVTLSRSAGTPLRRPRGTNLRRT